MRVMPDGGVHVVNRGLNDASGEWDEAIGKAYFVGESDVGQLKVSFFGPFYGSYIVFELEENYEYAFISGPKTSYLWLLARKPEIDEDIMSRFRQMAESRGFDLDELIVVNHSKPE